MEEKTIDYDAIAQIGTVDVIIPTYHPDEKLESLIKRLHKQTIQPRHIYIMNTEENFFKNQEVNHYEDITVHHISKYEFDHGGTRNRAASQSDADFLLFMTQDAVPKNKHLIEQLLLPMEDDEIGVSYARQLGDKQANYLEYYTRTFNYPAKSRKKTKDDLATLGIKTFFCSNVCALYRRSTYEQMGGFVLHAIFNEDMMMAASMIEAGYAVYYAADAKVIHWHDYTGMQQLKRNFDLAVSQEMAGGLLKEIKSEKEGVRLVVKTAGHMLKRGKIGLMFRSIWLNGCKFIGYRLGKNYRHLSRGMIRKLTMSPSFWTGYWDRLMQL